MLWCSNKRLENIEFLLHRIFRHMADDSQAVAALQVSVDAAVADLAALRASVKSVSDQLAAAIAAAGVDNSPALAAMKAELDAAVAIDAPAPVAPPST
jgi:hypothetical protein